MHIVQMDATAFLPHPLRPLPIYGQRICIDGSNCLCHGSKVPVPGGVNPHQPQHPEPTKPKQPQILAGPLCLPNFYAHKDFFKLTSALGHYNAAVVPLANQVKDSRIEALNIVQQTLASRGLSKPTALPVTQPTVQQTAGYGDSFPSQFNYGRKVFPCPQCRYNTDRRNNLKRHMLTMHQNCSKLLECCGILFTTKASLREHSLIFHYHGYTCFYCGRRFCRKALLKRHLSVHNGQKDFVCSVCDYATSHKSNLERHRKVHARQDGDCSKSDIDVNADSFDITVDDVNTDANSTDVSVCSDSEDEEIDVQEI